MTGRSYQRIRRLEESRAQVVDDSAAALRRIERDLHDGTQAQLATLVMRLGQAKEKLELGSEVPFDPEGALELVDAAHRQAKADPIYEHQPTYPDQERSGSYRVPFASADETAVEPRSARSRA